MTRPLSIWVVSDGRAGIENQALGLAEAVQRLTPATITVKRLRWRAAFDKLPSALKAPWMLDPSSDAVVPAPEEGWPDLWIATGRATLPLSASVRREKVSISEPPARATASAIRSASSAAWASVRSNAIERPPISAATRGRGRGDRTASNAAAPSASRAAVTRCGEPAIDSTLGPVAASCAGATTMS